MVAEDCGAPCCPPVSCFAGSRYIQPEVVKSCKPPVQYKRSTAPIESNTIYKCSFNPIDMCSENSGRMAPFLPKPNICMDPSIKMDNETVTQLSYPSHGFICRQAPILPHPRQFFPTGPIQDLTTQKHDYVAKPMEKRPMIPPNPCMKLTTVPLDCQTVQKLSYAHPCNTVQTVSCKPNICYKKPCQPMDVETTHQLSYMPLCPPAKEIYPWASRPMYKLPCLPIEKHTTYKLSYPGATGKRDPLVIPKSNIQSFDVPFDGRTIYNESFVPNNPNCCRELPCKPIPNLCCNPNIKMDPDTMYSLAYPGHFSVPKQQPVLPYNQPMRCGSVQDLTTQKHDYVCKPVCVRKPFLPNNNMSLPKLPLDCTTIANSSYMCPGAVKTVSCKPNLVYKRPCLPMEVETTQKLSFQPMRVPQKECLPWAVRPHYRLPQVPMDTETVQKLSYAPPGRFVSGGGDSCCIPAISDQFPKAALC